MSPCLFPCSSSFLTVGILMPAWVCSVLTWVHLLSFLFFLGFQLIVVTLLEAFPDYLLFCSP